MDIDRFVTLLPRLEINNNSPANPGPINRDPRMEPALPQGSQMKTVQGPIVAIVVPFDEKLRVDRAALEDYQIGRAHV